MDSRNSKNNLIASIVITIIGLFALISGVIMTLEKTGADRWFYSPGFFPIFVGFVLFILGSIMFINEYKNGARFNIQNTQSITKLTNNDEVKKSCIAIGTLAIYIFVLFGRIPFIISTFIYLFTTMTIFRTNKFALWKICLISLLFSIFLYVFFVMIAKVPLV